MGYRIRPRANSWAYGQHGYSPDNGSFVVCACAHHVVWEDGTVFDCSDGVQRFRYIMDNDVTYPAPVTAHCEPELVRGASKEEVE